MGSRSWPTYPRRTAPFSWTRRRYSSSSTTFASARPWQSHARYEVGDGLTCGFRQDAERDGELDLVLYFGPAVSPAVRMLFQGLFESFLTRRNLTVMRFEAVVCSQCGHPLERAVVRQCTKKGKDFVFCNDCGKRLMLPKEEPIQLTLEQQTELETQRRAAAERTRFEQAIFRVQAYVAEQKIEPPECFISYAWGEKEHERWVEKSLASDLQKAGIRVVLDRWENTRIGASVPRFVKRVAKCDRIVVVETPQTTACSPRKSSRIWGRWPVVCGSRAVSADDGSP